MSRVAFFHLINLKVLLGNNNIGNQLKAGILLVYNLTHLLHNIKKPL